MDKLIDVRDPGQKPLNLVLAGHQIIGQVRRASGWPHCCLRRPEASDCEYRFRAAPICVSHPAGIRIRIASESVFIISRSAYSHAPDSEAFVHWAGRGIASAVVPAWSGVTAKIMPDACSHSVPILFPACSQSEQPGFWGAMFVFLVFLRVGASIYE